MAENIEKIIKKVLVTGSQDTIDNTKIQTNL